MRDDYSKESKDSLFYLWEKVSALHIYLVRKVVLAVCLVLFETSRHVSNVLGFNFSGSVSDREAWKWKPYENIPFYRAYLEWEKVN
jgi:hypothetical protein